MPSSAHPRRRLTFIGLCAAGAVAAAYFGQPLAHDNSDAILVIITVMTVFAGFLVAIIAILGDPAMLPPGSWRSAENKWDVVYSAVTTHTWLFRFYLVAIALLFAGVLVEKAPDCQVPEIWKTWIERLYLFFGVFSFLLTMALPGMLAKLQMERVEAEIQKRRRKDSIKQ
jgi:hypothetical protein